MKAFWSNRKARLGSLLVGGLILVALIGVVLYDANMANAEAGPILAAPDSTFWFGTNMQGKDVFIQTLYGAAPTIFYSLLIGAGVTFLSILFGVTAGFFGGRVDLFLNLFINIFLLIPSLPLLIVLAAVFQQHSDTISGPLIIAIVLIGTGWAWGARVLRSQAMTLSRRPFIEAARLSGDGSMTVIFYHLVPNMASLIGTSFIGATTFAVGAQVGLEFLGFGDPSNVTWGTNLYWATQNQALLTGAWWTFLPTGLGIAFFAFGLVLMTFALDEITNPSLATRRHFKASTGQQPDLDTAVVHSMPPKDVDFATAEGET
ncbi:MAG: peptide ABC transporter permease [Myxococcales bacterium]|nr:peptide ABC transporter permease [Myxococcales bacterium]|tara:strand:+ start:1057 stop:2007 length:951 start_codon:yes stop_codon:yes gene_type:complete